MEERDTASRHMKTPSSSLVIRKVKITMRNDIPFLTCQLGQKVKSLPLPNVGEGTETQELPHAAGGCHSTAVGCYAAGLNLCVSVPPLQISTLCSAQREKGLYGKRLFLVFTDAVERVEAAKPGFPTWVQPLALRAP